LHRGDPPACNDLPMTAISRPSGQPAVPAQKPAGVAGEHHAQPSVGDLVKEASTQFSTLLHSEVELAKVELKSSIKNAGTGAGFFGAAAALLLFSLTFGFIALAEGLVAAGLWRWLSYLIVFAGFTLIAGLLVWLGIRKVKRVRGPERTIATTKESVAYLRDHTKHT
jgi:hypothetical protein